MLDDPKNVLITGGTFTNNVINLKKTGMDILREGIAPGAFHNSAERYDPPKCYPGTRKAVIDAIMAWIEDGQKTSFIMWLYGPAGAGKSAIAQTIAELCLKLGILVASFFWSRTAAGRNDETRLIASLAYQLALAIPQIAIYVEKAIENNPALLSLSLDAQMQSLIVEPLEKAQAQQGIESGQPRLVVLDGLDECGKSNEQAYILKVISSAVEKFPVPIFFLIASRPEQAIRHSFNSKTLSPVITRLALDDSYRPNEDIKLFLVDNFLSIRENHPLGSLLPPTWPGPDTVKSLVQKSSGQFIYAATVVKFMKSVRRRPDTQLNVVLGINPGGTGKDMPFAELDALYRQIFSSVEDLPRVLEILSCIFLVNSENFVRTCKKIEDILSYQHGDLNLILVDLHSVLHIPDVTDAHGELHVLHASLQDFFTDPHRSREFYINTEEAHTRLAQHFLRWWKGFRDDGTLARDGLHIFTLDAVNCILEHSMRAHPTKELLNAFFDFDILTWTFMIDRNKDYPNQLAKLTSWCLKQDSIAEQLFGRGKLSGHIFKQLVQDYFNTKEGRIKITAMTHPAISDDFQCLLKALYTKNAIPTKTLTDPTDFRYNCPGPLDWVIGLQFRLSDTGPLVQDFIIQLQQFLCDPDQAGDYYVHPGMYADFSLTMAKLIFEKPRKMSNDRDISSRPEQTELDRHACGFLWGMKFLPFFLANSSYNPVLAKHLLNLNEPYAFIEALGLYLERAQPDLPIPPPVDTNSSGNNDKTSAIEEGKLLQPPDQMSDGFVIIVFLILVLAFALGHSFYSRLLASLL